MAIRQIWHHFSQDHSKMATLDSKYRTNETLFFEGVIQVHLQFVVIFAQRHYCYPKNHPIRDSTHI